MNATLHVYLNLHENILKLQKHSENEMQLICFQFQRPFVYKLHKHKNTFHLRLRVELKFKENHVQSIIIPNRSKIASFSTKRLVIDIGQGWSRW